jgi:hypothetical protein
MMVAGSSAAALGQGHDRICFWAALQVLAPFAIGFTVFVCHLVAVPIDGCSINRKPQQRISILRCVLRCRQKLATCQLQCALKSALPINQCTAASGTFNLPIARPSLLVLCTPYSGALIRASSHQRHLVRMNPRSADTAAAQTVSRHVSVQGQLHLVVTEPTPTCMWCCVQDRPVGFLVSAPWRRVAASHVCREHVHCRIAHVLVHIVTQKLTQLAMHAALQGGSAQR